MEQLILLAELIGTVAFAMSGAVLGIRRNTDIFGVVCLGVITATGGGVIRDLILGITPPTSFIDPIYIITAIITSLIVFCFYSIQIRKNRNLHFSPTLLLLMDSVGLGIFTSVGVMTVIRLYGSSNAFLCIFSGMITGVGGGLMRDVIVMQMPDIFVKHIYAVASIIGAIVCLYTYRLGNSGFCIYIGMAAVILIRLLAAHYRWNLPSIDYKE